MFWFLKLPRVTETLSSHSWKSLTFRAGSPSATASAMALAPAGRTKQSPKLITWMLRRCFKACKDRSLLDCDCALFILHQKFMKSKKHLLNSFIFQGWNLLKSDYFKANIKLLVWLYLGINGNKPSTPRWFKNIKQLCIKELKLFWLMVVCDEDAYLAHLHRKLFNAAHKL